MPLNWPFTFFQSARFLVLDRRMTESWSQLGAAVRIAQAIGLHRDGADMVRVILVYYRILLTTSPLGHGAVTGRTAAQDMVSIVTCSWLCAL